MVLRASVAMTFSALTNLALNLSFVSFMNNAADRQRLNKDLIKRGYDIAHNRYPEGSSSLGCALSCYGNVFSLPPPRISRSAARLRCCVERCVGLQQNNGTTERENEIVKRLYIHG